MFPQFPFLNPYFSLPYYPFYPQAFPQNNYLQIPQLGTHVVKEPFLKEETKSGVMELKTTKTQTSHLQGPSSQQQTPKEKKILTNRKVVKKTPRNRQANSNPFSKNKHRNLEQKEGRNSNSNLLRMFFRRLEFKIKKNPLDILTIIEKYQLKITLTQFSDWVDNVKVDFRNYIRVTSIRKLFIGSTFVQEHAKIMRILLSQFVEKEALPCYLTSKKAKRGVMHYNLKSLRYIMEDLIIGDQPLY